MNQFDNCFEKHSFEELNNTDCDMLHNCVNFYLEKFNVPNPIIFDIGTNAGSFIKVLKNFNINNIHSFEPHPIISIKTKELYPYITMNNYCLGNINGMIDIYTKMECWIK